jgi:hypothetical protein
MSMTLVSNEQGEDRSWRENMATASANRSWFGRTLSPRLSQKGIFDKQRRQVGALGVAEKRKALCT